eukprot:s4920_g5.t1
MAGHADLTVAAADLTVVRLVMSDVGDGRPLVGGLIVTFSPPADDGESDDGSGEGLDDASHFERRGFMAKLPGELST